MVIAEATKSVELITILRQKVVFTPKLKRRHFNVKVYLVTNDDLTFEIAAKYHSKLNESRRNGGRRIEGGGIREMRY